MGPEGLLLCSLEPVTSLCTKSDISIQSTTSHPVSLRSILTLRFHLHLDLKTSLTFNFFDRIFVCTSHLCYACDAPRLFSIYYPNNIWLFMRIMDLLSLWDILQPPATSCRLSRNTFLNTACSETRSIYVLFIVRRQVSYPYETIHTFTYWSFTGFV